MNYQEYTATIKKLEMNYKYRIPEEEKKDWFEEFKNIDFIYFARAIKFIIKSQRFFPNMFEILDGIEKTKKIEFSSGEKKYKMLKQGIKPKWLDKKIKLIPLGKEEKRNRKNFRGVQMSKCEVKGQNFEEIDEMKLKMLLRDGEIPINYFRDYAELICFREKYKIDWIAKGKKMKLIGVEK